MAIKESKTVIKEVLEYWKQELESKQNPSAKSNFITKRTAHLEKLITQLDSDQIKSKDLRKIDKQINRLVILSLKAKNPELADKLSQIYKTEEAFQDKKYRYIYFDKMTLLSYDKAQLTNEANFGIEENAKKISKESKYNNIQNGMDLFSAIYIAASVTLVILMAFPTIAIATLAVTLSSSWLVSSFNERKQISEFKEAQLMSKEILQDISKTLTQDHQQEVMTTIKPMTQREQTNTTNFVSSHKEESTSSIDKTVRKSQIAEILTKDVSKTSTAGIEI
jgi:hypothetical protein